MDANTLTFDERLAELERKVEELQKATVEVNHPLVAREFINTLTDNVLKFVSGEPTRDGAIQWLTQLPPYRTQMARGKGAVPLWVVEEYMTMLRGWSKLTDSEEQALDRWTRLGLNDNVLLVKKLKDGGNKTAHPTHVWDVGQQKYVAVGDFEERSVFVNLVEDVVRSYAGKQTFRVTGQDHEERLLTPGDVDQQLSVLFRVARIFGGCPILSGRRDEVQQTDEN